MARIFAGANHQQIDRDVLRAFQTLPDDFWVLAEFNLRCNVDWLIIHPSPQGPSSLIAIEVKRTSATLRGEINGTWQQTRSDGATTELGSSSRYRNPYWQAVEVADNLKDWLWNNQAVFRQADEVLPPEAFRVWPDLLILSPPGITHRLPQRPDTKFGQFFFDIESLLTHIKNWKPSQLDLVSLTERDMVRLVELLHLMPLDSAPAKATQGDQGIGALPPEAKQSAPGANGEQESDIARQLMALLQQRESFEQQLLQALEEQLASNRLLRRSIETLCLRIEQLTSPLARDTAVPTVPQVKQTKPTAPKAAPAKPAAPTMPKAAQKKAAAAKAAKTKPATTQALSGKERVIQEIVAETNDSPTRTRATVEKNARFAIDGIMEFFQKNPGKSNVPVTDLGQWLRAEYGIGAKVDIGLPLGDLLGKLNAAAIVRVKMNGDTPHVSPVE